MIDYLRPGAPVSVKMMNTATLKQERTVRSAQTVQSKADTYAGSGEVASAPAGHGFYDHVSHALCINKERRPIYARMTGGKSLAVSNLMINLERMCLPLGLYYDFRGRKFNRQSIPVIADDFVSMDNIGKPTDPPRYRGRADEATLARVSQMLAAYKQTVMKAAAAGDFRQAAQASYDVLQQVRKIEETNQCHFFMVRHIVESTGLAAMNAIGYSETSKGQTDKLSRDFLKTQVFAIGLAVTIDRKAQEIQSMGVGILVNDIPYIPFEERWRDSSRQPQATR